MLCWWCARQQPRFRGHEHQRMTGKIQLLFSMIWVLSQLRKGTNMQLILWGGIVLFNVQSPPFQNWLGSKTPSGKGIGTFTHSLEGFEPFWWGITGFMGKAHLTSSLEGAINHERPIKSSQFCISTVKTLGKYLGVPTWTSVCINPPNFMFHGLPHPWQIRIANITSTDGYQNCNDQVLSLNSEVVVLFLSVMYSYTFFLFHPFCYIIFLFLYLGDIFYSFVFLQKITIPLFHCKQIVLK